MSINNLFGPPPQIPFFQIFYIPALNPGAILDYDAENTLRHYRLFSPFRNFQIINTSSSNIEVTFDYSPNRKTIAVTGGAPGTHNQPFRSFQVKNIGSIATTGNQDVVCWIETL
jgi:hypothetical protein